MKRVSNVVVSIIFLLQCGCGTVPEFEPQPPPPPAPLFGEAMTGKATWYGSLFHGRRMHNGEQFDMEKRTASHESYPLGSIIEITNPDNGKTTTVVITDRHNLERGHKLSLSKKAAQELGVYPKSNFEVNYIMIE